MHGRYIGARIAVVLLCLGAAASGKEDGGKIMRPVDGAALSSGEVDIVATAPAGKLQLDGAALLPDEPFPNVFHATAKADPGKHTLALIWEGGRKEVNFFVGENPPSEYKPFSQHRRWRASSVRSVMASAAAAVSVSRAAASTATRKRTSRKFMPTRPI